MEDKDKLNSESTAAAGAKDKKTFSDRITRKKNSKVSWAILAVLIVGLVAFVTANPNTFSRYFGQMNPFASSASRCGTTSRSSSSSSSIANGASVYSSSCYTQSQEDAKRWTFIRDASSIVAMVSVPVIAIGILILSWQIFKLSKAISKRK